MYVRSSVANVQEGRRSITNWAKDRPKNCRFNENRIFKFVILLEIGRKSAICNQNIRFSFFLLRTFKKSILRRQRSGKSRKLAILSLSIFCGRYSRREKGGDGIFFSQKKEKHIGERPILCHLSQAARTGTFISKDSNYLSW